MSYFSFLEKESFFFLLRSRPFSHLYPRAYGNTGVGDCCYGFIDQFLKAD